MTTNKTSAKEVKPCPFCGEQPSITRDGIYCSTKRCVASYVFAEIEKWNTRHDAGQASKVGVLDKDKLIEWINENAITNAGDVLEKINNDDFDVKGIYESD